MKRFRSLFGEKSGVKFGKPSRTRLRPGVERVEDRCLAAVDTFIWFNPGPANVAQFAGENSSSSKPAFEIKDFSFGVENPTTIGSATGGTGAGKVRLNEFVIKTTADSASRAFLANCVAGSYYKTVTIDVPKASGGSTSAGKPFLQFKFNTVFTTKVDWSGHGDEGPQESITFVCGGLSVKYVKQEPTGPVGKTVASAGPGQIISTPVVTVVPPASNPNCNQASAHTIPS
jgi:type VI protein secretion system component Hcp